MIAPAVPSSKLAPTAALFRSLADPTRLAILQMMAMGEIRVVDLTRRLELAQSSVSAHVACLRDCGLVTGRAVGRQIFYSLAVPELLDVLASVESLVHATGRKLDRCPAYGGDTRPGERRTPSAP